MQINVENKVRKCTLCMRVFTRENLNKQQKFIKALEKEVV